MKLLTIAIPTFNHANHWQQLLREWKPPYTAAYLVSLIGTTWAVVVAND